MAVQNRTELDSAMYKRPRLSAAIACTASDLAFRIWLVDELDIILDCKALAFAARIGRIEVSSRRLSVSNFPDLESRLGHPPAEGWGVESLKRADKSGVLLLGELCQYLLKRRRILFLQSDFFASLTKFCNDVLHSDGKVVPMSSVKLASETAGDWFVSGSSLSASFSYNSLITSSATGERHWHGVLFCSNAVATSAPQSQKKLDLRE